MVLVDSGDLGGQPSPAAERDALAVHVQRRHLLLEERAAHPRPGLAVVVERVDVPRAALALRVEPPLRAVDAQGPVEVLGVDQDPASLAVRGDRVPGGRVRGDRVPGGRVPGGRVPGGRGPRHGGGGHGGRPGGGDGGLPASLHGVTPRMPGPKGRSALRWSIREPASRGHGVRHAVLPLSWPVPAPSRGRS
ncbi:hypothetical protein F9B16_45130 [Actinomadura montaniterrae]|uniref:Uncharacterized protein n=1 Tax=Actinomadura montaniterrae TaxID=1803903 RepID=A0A6L3VDK1_9ACTN|nr:hypothetical protein F9B16_45130 [Actinomadura montaniterrae]